MELYKNNFNKIGVHNIVFKLPVTSLAQMRVRIGYKCTETGPCSSVFEKTFFTLAADVCAVVCHRKEKRKAGVYSLLLSSLFTKLSCKLHNARLFLRDG